MYIDLRVKESDYKISKRKEYDGTINICIVPKKRNCKGCGKSFESNGTEFLCWKTKENYSVSGWFCKKHYYQAKILIKELR